MIDPIKICKFIPSTLKDLLSKIDNEVQKVEYFIRPWTNKVFEPINNIRNALVDRIVDVTDVVDDAFQGTGKVINEIYADMLAFFNLLLHVNSGSILYLFVLIVLPWVQSVWPVALSIASVIQIAIVMILILYIGQLYMFFSAII